jgi:hypothetical protein
MAVEVLFSIPLEGFVGSRVLAPELVRWLGCLLLHETRRGGGGSIASATYIKTT